MNSNDVRLGWLTEVPPERQLSPVQLQLTSFGASTSWQLPAFDAMRGEMTTESSSAPAMNAACGRGREVMIGVAIGAVNHDQRATNVFASSVEGSRAIDQRSRRSASERHPLGARLGRGEYRAR
jgi:hypothetical protein